MAEISSWSIQNSIEFSLFTHNVKGAKFNSHLDLGPDHTLSIPDGPYTYITINIDYSNIV